MQPLRGILTDEAGGFSVEVEGSIASAEGEGVQGEFAFPDSDAVMEGFLEGKTFILNPEGEGPVPIKLESVSTGEKDGFSTAEFAGV